MVRIQTHTCEHNGLRIVYEASPSRLPVSSVHIFVQVGSINEPVNMHGGAHFIEHMCFKGTPNVRTAAQIYQTYNNAGAYFNATTTKGYTYYSFKCHSRYLQSCIRMMSDMIMNSTFRRVEFDKERFVVEEEVLRDKDNMAVMLNNAIESEMYRGTSFERPVDTASFHANKHTTLQRADLVAMYRTLYTTDRMVVSVVSDLPFAHVLRWVKGSALGAATTVPFLLSRRRSQYRPIMQPPEVLMATMPDPRIHIIKYEGKSETTGINLVFRVGSCTSPHKWALLALSSILSGISGRLSMQLRERNGLTYSSNASLSTNEIGGTFTLSIEVDNRKVMHNNPVRNARHGPQKGALPVLVDMLCELYRHGVTDAEMTTMRQSVQGSLALKVEEGGDSLAFHNGVEYLMLPNESDIVSYRDLYKTYYERLRRTDITDVIHKYFVPENMMIGIIGVHPPSRSAVENVLRQFVMLADDRNKHFR